MTPCIMEQIKNINRKEIEDKDVIELGSAYDISGNARPILEELEPATYTGIDIIEGKFVDVVCDINETAYIFGEESFDVVISTEVLEHIKDWKSAVSNMKRLLKPNGMLFVSTRSKGFHYHGRPNDYWRFSFDDFSSIFSDMVRNFLVNDISAPGVILKTYKPDGFREYDLSNYEVSKVENT